MSKLIEIGREDEMSKLIEVEGKLNLAFYCPACRNNHAVSTIEPRPTWTWNGSWNKPTFSPSVRVVGYSNTLERKIMCHFFVKEGTIQYCSDSEHDLAGKTVQMEII